MQRVERIEFAAISLVGNSNDFSKFRGKNMQKLLNNSENFKNDLSFFKLALTCLVVYNYEHVNADRNDENGYLFIKTIWNEKLIFQ